MLTIDVTFDTHFDSLKEGAERRASQAVAQAALEIEREAKTRAAVDTGFMRGAIGAEEIDQMNWQVVSGASYSVFVEFGTRKMDAQPFMTPAAEIVKPQFERAMRNLL